MHACTHIPKQNGHLKVVTELLSHTEDAPGLLLLEDKSGRSAVTLAFEGGVHVPLIRYMMQVILCFAHRNCMRCVSLMDESPMLVSSSVYARISSHAPTAILSEGMLKRAICRL